LRVARKRAIGGSSRDHDILKKGAPVYFLASTP
jgi:hypothetical protein